MVSEAASMRFVGPRWQGSRLVPQEYLRCTLLRRILFAPAIGNTLVSGARLLSERPFLFGARSGLTA